MESNNDEDIEERSKKSSFWRPERTSTKNRKSGVESSIIKNLQGEYMCRRCSYRTKIKSNYLRHRSSLHTTAAMKRYKTLMDN
jgi:hypothetical protein